MATPSAQDHYWYHDFEALYGYSPNIFCRLKTFRSIALAVGKNLGVALAWSKLVDPSSVGNIPITRLSYGSTSLDSSYYISYRKGHYLSDAAQYLINLCIEAYRK